MTTKRILLAVTATLAASVLVLVGVAGVDNTAQAQANSLQPANVQVVNGPNAGEAVVSWDAVAGAAYYRVGWVSVTNYLAVTDAGRDWQEAFYFVDLKNSGQTSFTISRLEPGVLHVFRVAGNSSQYGEPQWSDFQWLTLNSDTTACPMPTPTPTPGPTTTATPAPTATGGDYDADNDGLIEIRSIVQLDAIRHDLDGNGAADDAKNDAAAYAAAFPNAATRMGCRDAGCTGYELANDLDFGTAASGVGWVPIGYYRSRNDYARFAADFDGNGRTISNLSISQRNSNYVGLFGVLASSSQVRRVGLESISVIGDDFVGGLVGSNGGRVSDSYVTGTVSGNRAVGGLIGANHGAVTDSYAGATVVGAIGGSSYAGGLVGSNTGSIIRSYAKGAVSGRGYTGGLTGWNGGSISASYATGTVSSGALYTGGLVGSNDGGITASYATGSVSNSWMKTGGLVGQNDGGITASYATGAATGDSWTGGLVGDNNGNITASYATGVVTSSGTSYIGGLVGDGRNVHFSYWDTETSGWTESNGGVGKTTSELQSPTSNAGIYSGWSAVQWDFGTASQYPVLKVEGLSVAAQRGQATAAQPGAGSGTPATADRAALVALYQATGGANWANSGGWLSNAPLDQWYGVVTDPDDRVTDLELDANGLSGSLPAELGSLDQLTILRMGSNDLTGPIPPALGNLSNLSILGLGNNQLTGSIPAELGNLSGLTRVSTWNNQLSGPIPVELGNLPRLTKLSLGSNQLSGPIPSSLGNLSSLESLGLQRNQLSGPIPATLGGLTNLIWLDFDFNQLSGSIPPQLGNLTNLTVLRMGSNQLSGPVPAELGSLSNLSILGLGNNQLTGSIPPQLGNLVSLTRFSLWNNDVTGPIPAELGNLSRLTKLSLGSNRLSGAIPSSLGNLSNLKELGLQSNDLSGPIPAQLGNLANLTHLSLNGNQLTGSVPAKLGSLAALTRLYLQGNQLSGTIPAELGRLSKLDVLNLSHNLLTGAIPAALAAGSTARAVPPGNGLTGYDAVERGGAFPAIEIAYAGPGRWSYEQTPEQAGALANLRVLNLSYNRLSGAMPASLGSLASLKRLYLNSNRFTGTIPAALGRLNLQTRRVDNVNEVNECGHNSTPLGVKNDRETLQYLYSVTDNRNFFQGSRDDPSWKEFAGWEKTFEGDASIPLKDWHGVTVNSHGRVTELRLGNNGLAGDTSNWHEDIANRNSATLLDGAFVWDYALLCLEVLDLSDNGLGGDIGEVLSELSTLGKVELRLKGNSFENWIDDDGDDPESVIMEIGDSYLADAIEKRTGADVAPSDVAGVGLKILRYTAKSKPARFLARTGGGISILNAALTHEVVTDALIELIFESDEAACNSLLSKINGGDSYCRTGFFADVEDGLSFIENGCVQNICNQGCPPRPACSGQ